jgi:hypothetical protein
MDTVPGVVQMSLTFHLASPRQEMVKQYFTPVQEYHLCACIYKEDYAKLSPIAGVFLQLPMGGKTLQDYLSFSLLNIYFYNTATILSTHTHLGLTSFLSSWCL